MQYSVNKSMNMLKDGDKAEKEKESAIKRRLTPFMGNIYTGTQKCALRFRTHPLKVPTPKKTNVFKRRTPELRIPSPVSRVPY